MNHVIRSASRLGAGVAAALTVMAVLGWGGGRLARAQGDTCAGAYEKAQEERAAGRLRSSLAQLRICVAPACAEFMRADCSRWMDEVEPAIPSVVLGARRGGREVTRVRVTCDGVEVEHPLDGKAIAVDPGRHLLSFVAADDPRPVTAELTIREGERNRLIEVELPAPSGHPAERSGPTAASPDTGAAGAVHRDGDDSAPREQARRSPWPYVAAAIGAAGLVGFTTFALLGRSKETSLDSSCKPSCSSSQVAAVRLEYRLADASLGLGLVAVGVATYLFVTRSPSVEAAAGTPTAFSVAPRLFSNGAGLGASASF